MDRAAQILNAAKVCAQKDGLHNASIKNIAKCANISTGLIYRYYKNKSYLIEALVINITDTMIQLLDIDNLQHKHSSNVHLEKTQSTSMPDIQDDIFLLMDIAAEAFRNERYKSIISTAHRRLRQNIVNHEKMMNPDADERTLHTRIYFLSILIDGLLVQESRKGYAADTNFNDLTNKIAFCVKNPPY